MTSLQHAKTALQHLDTAMGLMTCPTRSIELVAARAELELAILKREQEGSGTDEPD